MSQPKIAIMGAGPGGLTLARLLHVANTPVELLVFERDASPAARRFVGGTLDLHSDTGLAALREAGLWQQFKRYARYDGQALIFADKYGTKVFSEAPGDAPTSNAEEEAKMAQGITGPRPEIDRERLKEILLDSVPRDCVKWGWKVTSVNPDGTIDFDGKARQGPFDLVVGADGAWSRVRHVLTDERPSYSGIAGLEFRIPNPTEEHPAISKMVGRGSYFAYCDGKGLTGQRMGDESIQVRCFVQEDESYAHKLVAEYDNDGVKRKILERYADWAPSMQAWIKCSDSESVKGWSLYELPVGHTWEHRKGFTLLGDAAHLMTPFAGEGVNAAMKDALELSDAIGQSLKHGDKDLDAAIKEYEEAMFPRAAKVQAETMRNKTYMFREDAPLGFMMKMLEVLAEIEPSMMSKAMSLPPVRAVVYCCLWLWLGLGKVRYRLGVSAGRWRFAANGMTKEYR